MRKQNIKSPEDLMLEAIHRMPKFDAKQAWREIQKERKREKC